MKPSLIALSLAVPLVACAGQRAADPDAAVAVSPSDPADPAATSPVPDETTFHETIVTFAADGTATSTDHVITAGEERAENAARARGVAPLTARDGTCASTSFWLYDRQDYTGNRICFAATARSI
jgi:hypothetical protein